MSLSKELFYDELMNSLPQAKVLGKLARPRASALAEKSFIITE